MNAEVNRLPAPWGSELDRNNPVAFEFENDSVFGYAGDTIASALAANDHWLLSRSFKYHRPRGILTMAGQDANTLVQLPSDPNALADRTPVSEGQVVTGQNCTGSLRRDRAAWVQYFARFLPVGFYYHAFFRPRGIWNIWSQYFRRRAGLGVIDTTFRTEDYDKQYLFYDVLVVGGGPAGMQTAIAEAESGASVLLVDENSRLGGSLSYTRCDVDEGWESRRRQELQQQVLADSRIEVKTAAIVNGWFADNWLPVIQGKRMFKVRAERVVLCSGVLEQPAIFRNNDLPGVMLGSAAQRLIKMYAVRPGRRAVVLAGNDDAYGVALDLLDAGVEVAAVVELRSEASLDPRAIEVAARSIRVLKQHAVYAATGRNRHIAAVEVRKIVGAGECAESGEQIACDLLCMSIGYMPAYQLACQAGGTLSYDDAAAEFTIAGLPASMSLAGAVAGESGRGANFPWPIFPHPDGKEFVDFDEDLHIADILNATRAGYTDVQLVKRYSTCGMGPSQGRHSALVTARLVARETGKTVAETGVTTARPPFAPETVAHCAGRSFFPALRTSMHHRHLEAGAHMLLAGDWYRPAYYGESPNEAIADEINQVRQSVGIIDVSTLGGIELRGPDAAEFLNRIYTFSYLKQAVGTVRYALMTNEAGVVIDDGVACRVADDHFYVTATTGGVDQVFRSMQKWQAQWRLNVRLVNVTSAFCGINVAGPSSRKVVSAICDDIDLDAAAFPYLGYREGMVAGVPARLLRVGFVGELGYEIHAPQHCGEALWDALLEAGAEYQIKPVGIEAQRMLRLEKGHVIIGQDTDAMSTPRDLQMDWAIGRTKPFYVGKGSIDLLGDRPANRVLAGFEIADDSAIPKEGHLVFENGSIIGRVTSCGRSPTLNRTIGLAFVPPERSGTGNRLRIRCDGAVEVTAVVVDTPFYDAENARQGL